PIPSWTLGLRARRQRSTNWRLAAATIAVSWNFSPAFPTSPSTVNSSVRKSPVVSQVPENLGGVPLSFSEQGQPKSSLRGDHGWRVALVPMGMLIGLFAGLVNRISTWARQKGLQATRSLLRHHIDLRLDLPVSQRFERLQQLRGVLQLQVRCQGRDVLE